MWGKVRSKREKIQDNLEAKKQDEETRDKKKWKRISKNLGKNGVCMKTVAKVGEKEGRTKG